MKIAKVKLIQDGLKGIQVEYQQISTKENRKFNDEYGVKYTAPIHKELRRALNKLKFHLINFYKLRSALEGYVSDDFVFQKLEPKEPKESKKYLQAKEIWDSFVITGIKSNNLDQFLITGKLKMLGNLTVAINSPLVTEDANYAYFTEVMEVVEEIYKETELFVKGEKVADDRQVVIDFHTSKGDMEKAHEAEHKTAEEILAEAQMIIENAGGIVLMSDDMEKNGEEEVPATMTVAKNEDESDWNDEPEEKPKKVKQA